MRCAISREGRLVVGRCMRLYQFTWRCWLKKTDVTNAITCFPSFRKQVIVIANIVAPT